MYCFTQFFFGIFDLAERTRVAQTTLLTTVALLYVVTDQLPNTSYLTVIDRFFQLSFFFQGVVWLLSLSYGFGEEEGFSDSHVEYLRRVDSLAAVIIPGLYVFFAVYFFVPSIVRWFNTPRNAPPSYTLLGAPTKERVRKPLPFYPIESDNCVEVGKQQRHGWRLI